MQMFAKKIHNDYLGMMFNEFCLQQGEQILVYSRKEENALGNWGVSSNFPLSGESTSRD